MLPEGWINSLEPVDYLRSGALLIMFIATGCFGTQATWVHADIMASFATGCVFFLFPNVMLEMQMSGNVNAMHCFVTQAIGIVMIMSTLKWIMNRHSKDDNVWISFFLSRVINLGFLFFCQFHIYQTSKGFSVQFVTFGMFGTFLWLLGHLRQLSQYGRNAYGGNLWGGEGDRLSKHLLIDIIFGVHTMCYNLGYPSFVLGQLNFADVKVDDVHVHLLRGLAVLGLESVIVSIMALNYANKEDRRTVLLDVFLIRLGIYAVIATYNFSYNMLPPNFFYQTLLFHSPPIINVGLGYFWVEKST